MGFGMEGYGGVDLDPQKSGTITDGVTDPGAYLGSSPLICWVLKEAYEPGSEDGDSGGWSMTSDVFAKPKEYPNLVRSKTFKTVIYVTYSLQNGFAGYTKTDEWFAANNPEAATCLKSIALVNINKMPAASSSNDADLAQKYKFWRPILFWQLRQYQPRIVIFGNTLKHFQADLGIKDEELTQGKDASEDITYIVKDNVLYVHAYHPSCVPFKISLEKYVQGITNVVKLNLEKIK
jgi:hypothetical protein